MIGHVLLALAAVAGPTRLPPIDECAADAGFVAFRKTLSAAVDKHDVKALMALVDDHVQIDFGGGAGKNDFRKAWGLSEPGESAVWREIKEAFRLGCTMQGGAYMSPSLGAQLDADADPYDTYLAVKSGAELRSEPGGRGEVLRRLDWDVMTFVPGSDDTDFIRVKLSDGQIGFVRLADVRSPIGYRLQMQKIDGAWRITAFVQGD